MKISTARRQLNQVEASEGLASYEDELSVGDVNENTFEVEDTQVVDAQLKEANDEIVRLNQLLGDAKIEIIVVRKGVSRKRLGIEAFQDSDKDVQFYTGLPSVAIFYLLLEYLSPAGKRCNVVHNATAQNLMKEGSNPGNAERRE